MQPHLSSIKNRCDVALCLCESE